MKRRYTVIDIGYFIAGLAYGTLCTIVYFLAIALLVEGVRNILDVVTTWLHLT